MSNNIPFSQRELDIIRAVKKADPNAKFSFNGRVVNRFDFLYGGVKWETNPVSWEQVLENILESKTNES